MERLCPALGVNSVSRVKEHGSILPTTAKKLMRPMKWVYDRPLTTLVQAHNYRADVPIKATSVTVVQTNPIPTMEIEYTIQFGEGLTLRLLSQRRLEVHQTRSAGMMHVSVTS